MKLSEAAKQLGTTQVAIRKVLVKQGLGSMSQKKIDDETFEKVKEYLDSHKQLQPQVKAESRVVEQESEVKVKPHSQPQTEPQQGSVITSTSDNSQITQEEHLQQTKDALEIVQKGFSEQNLQDAIALGTLDGIQKVALRLQTARKTELDLLAQLSQANQQTTQSQLNQASELFNDLMNSQNGEVERLGKSQLASHKHEKERHEAIAKAQTLMQSMI